MFEREKILMFSLHQNLDVPNGLKALINQKWAWLLFTDLFRDVKIELLRFQVTKPVRSAANPQASGGELGCFLSPGLGLGFAGALVAAGTLGKTLGGTLVVVVVTSLKKSSSLKSERKKQQHSYNQICCSAQIFLSHIYSDLKWLCAKMLSSSHLRLLLLMVLFAFL